MDLQADASWESSASDSCLTEDDHRRRAECLRQVAHSNEEEELCFDLLTHDYTGPCGFDLCIFFFF